VWGKAGTVKIKTKTTPKVLDCGVHCMMVGYALNHAGDTYRMWDMKANCVHETRDVIWLRRMYFENKDKAQDVVIEPDADNPVEGVEIVEAREGEEPQADEEEVVEEEEEEVDAGNQTRSGCRVNRPMRFIEEMNAIASNYYIKNSKSEQHYYEAMQEIGALQSELGCVGAGLGGGFVNTNELHVMKYSEAMATPEAKQWKESVEHNCLITMFGNLCCAQPFLKEQRC
jgi:hypothetical protein